MKKNFFTGLVLLLPVVVTIIVVSFVVKLLTNPLIEPVAAALRKNEIFHQPFLFFSGEHVLGIISRVIILGAFLALILIVGFLGRWVFVNVFVNFCECGIKKIPIVSKVYKAFQDAVKTVFNKSENKFSEVVLVPFPHAAVRSIGLVASQKAAEGSEKQYQELVSVFVPGTPNPAMGFMLLFRREQLTSVDMKIPDALKFLVSCGVIIPEIDEK